VLLIFCDRTEPIPKRTRCLFRIASGPCDILQRSPDDFHYSEQRGVIYRPQFDIKRGLRIVHSNCAEREHASMLMLVEADPLLQRQG
jgi:hypothetical protein